MIKIVETEWNGELRREFDKMISSSTMDLFVDHLTARRDGLLAIAAWELFCSRKGGSDFALDHAHTLTKCIETLISYAKVNVVPGSVKIITEP